MRRRQAAISPDQERRVLTYLFLILGVPFVLLTAFVAADTSVDLSDLHARVADQNGHRIAGWAALSQSEDTKEIVPANGTIVAMAGYMMDPEQMNSTNSSFRFFTLMPDAGLLIHPAHRHPDQMVTVWLRPKTECVFRNRTLVLVSGHFESLDPMDSSQPIYALSDAQVRSAAPAELRSWFYR